MHKDSIFEGTFSCVAITLAAIMAQAAVYSLGIKLGDAIFPALATGLAGYAIYCSRNIEGQVLPSISSMSYAFAMTSILAAFTWKIRGVLFNADASGVYGLGWNTVIIGVLMPLAILAALGPFLTRQFSNQASPTEMQD